MSSLFLKGSQAEKTMVGVCVWISRHSPPPCRLQTDSIQAPQVNFHASAPWALLKKFTYAIYFVYENRCILAAIGSESGSKWWDLQGEQWRVVKSAQHISDAATMVNVIENYAKYIFIFTFHTGSLYSTHKRNTLRGFKLYHYLYLNITHI